MSIFDPSRSALNEGFETDVVQIGWRRDLGAGTVTHHILYPGTQLTPQYSSVLISRLLCYYLIDLVPDEGLHDAVSGLSETLEFHTSIQGAALLQSSVEARRLPASIGKTFQSPGFELDPD